MTSGRSLWFTHRSLFYREVEVKKILLYFVELETRKKLPPEEWEIDEEDEFDVFLFAEFLKKIGVRSMKPFTRHETQVLLTHIVDESASPPKTIFVNAHHI